MAKRKPRAVRAEPRRCGFIARTLGLTVCAALLGAAPALAAGEGQRVGVHFTGSGSGDVERAVLRLLDTHGFRAVRGGTIEDAAVERGASLEHSPGVRTVSRALGLGAFLSGQASSRRGVLSITMLLREGWQGGRLGHVRWSTRGGPRALAALVERELWPRLGEKLERLPPPHRPLAEPPAPRPIPPRWPRPCPRPPPSPRRRRVSRPRRPAPSRTPSRPVPAAPRPWSSRRPRLPTPRARRLGSDEPRARARPPHPPEPAQAGPPAGAPRGGGRGRGALGGLRADHRTRGHCTGGCTTPPIRPAA